MMSHIAPVAGIFGFRVILIKRLVAPLTSSKPFCSCIFKRNLLGIYHIAARGGGMIFCAALCRDCGESTVALCLEFAGKAELILLAVPLLEELLNHVGDILAW